MNFQYFYQENLLVAKLPTFFKGTLNLSYVGTIIARNFFIQNNDVLMKVGDQILNAYKIYTECRYNFEGAVTTLNDFERLTLLS